MEVEALEVVLLLEAVLAAVLLLVHFLQIQEVEGVANARMFLHCWHLAH